MADCRRDLIIVVLVTMFVSVILILKGPPYDFNDGIFDPILIDPGPDSDTFNNGKFVRRIVAVGDLHGDYTNALKVLQMSNVVDAHGNWTGDVDVFVQTGDIIDG